MGVMRMPLIKPPRDLTGVRCVKKRRDKNGDIQHDLRVLFDYTSPEWNLTTEEVLDLKELFMIYDSDKDGVLTFVQVKNAVSILGKQITDQRLLTIIKKFSNDTKNYSLEFNEFLKMIAHDKNINTSENCDELIEAFRVFDEDNVGTISKSNLQTILFKLGYCPLQCENIDDMVKICSDDGERIDYTALSRILVSKKQIRGEDDSEEKLLDI